MSRRAYVALGSNLGDRVRHLASARRGLGSLPQSRLLAASAVVETEPLGGRAQPPYLNQVVALDTALDPEALLDACAALERGAGRVRRERWASRTLDLDLVMIEGITRATPALTLPHPGLGERPFWREGLAELRRLAC